MIILRKRGGKFMLSQEQGLTYEEFLKLREQTENKVEFINGVVCMSPAPHPIHQDIFLKIAA
jgi:Uma2 family endonuclease